MRARIVVGVVVFLSLPSFVSAQQLVCGGHRVTGDSGSRVTLDADRGPLARPTQPQPPWMSARDRELWDQLVFDAYDHGGAQSDLPLEQRRTRTADPDRARTVDVCLPRSDRSYTGERLAPYADEQWWKLHIERWTGTAWRGSVSTNCGIQLYGVIRVTEGDPDEIDDDVLATAYTNRMGGRWMSGEIVFNPDSLRRIKGYQLEAALAHELGHLMGMYHTKPGTGFVMDAFVPTAPATWPAKEQELANLAYDVGPNVDYPGFVGATPVPAVSAGGLLLLVFLLLRIILHRNREESR